MSEKPLVATKLREIRTGTGFRLCDVSGPVGVSDSLVSLWEHGYSIRKVAHLQKLADVLNVTPDRLLGRRSRRAK